LAMLSVQIWSFWLGCDWHIEGNDIEALLLEWQMQIKNRKGKPVCVLLHRDG
jgi:hypothetical protein